MNMRYRKRLLTYSNRLFYKQYRHCELCHGERGGVRGNNQIINGQAICDNCHCHYDLAIAKYIK